MSGNFMKDSQIDFITAKNATKKIGEKIYRFKCKDSILYRYVSLDVVATSLEEATMKIKQDAPSLFIESHEEM
jgi:uncharacterized SAM-dependent methyltransferase